MTMLWQPRMSVSGLRIPLCAAGPNPFFADHAPAARRYLHGSTSTPVLGFEPHYWILVPILGVKKV